MTTTFPIRGLASDVVERIDAVAHAAGLSRNAYIVKVLTEHAQRVRPVATEESFRRAAGLAADLGDRDVMRAAWQ